MHLKANYMHLKANYMHLKANCMHLKAESDGISRAASECDSRRLPSLKRHRTWNRKLIVNVAFPLH
jgi:hypothetical protein